MGRMDSIISMSDFVPLVDVLEGVPAEEVVPTVPIVVHVQDKNKEDSDELFPENTKVKNKKRGRTEAETVTPVKKKAKKSPGNAPTRKTARAVKNRKTGGKAKLNAECTNYGDIKENCIVCTDRTNVATVSY